MDIVQTLCQEFQLKTQKCENVLRLIDDGNTIPFIARYRKEQTGSLDDQLLREIYERLQHLRGLDKRRGEIAAALEEQGNLTDELSDKLQKAATLTELEDLYRPFRPKRRTRATVAREKGLEPLALALLMQNQTKGTVQELAQPFVDPEKGVETAEDALQGARDILAEQMSDDADVRKSLRALAMRTGVLESKNAGEEDSVYATCYEFSQEVRNLPAHRVLAMIRGNALMSQLVLDLMKESPAVKLKEKELRLREREIEIREKLAEKNLQEDEPSEQVEFSFEREK